MRNKVTLTKQDVITSEPDKIDSSNFQGTVTQRYGYATRLLDFWTGIKIVLRAPHSTAGKTSSGLSPLVICATSEADFRSINTGRFKRGICQANRRLKREKR